MPFLNSCLHVNEAPFLSTYLVRNTEVSGCTAGALMDLLLDVVYSSRLYHQQFRCCTAVASMTSLLF